MPSRARSWLDRWGPILPVLLAEATVWLGFGALLPIMPLYFTEHGTDLPTLGLVIAAWPAARLVSEPLFGWLADRTARKPLMLGGLVVAGVATVLPLAFLGPLAFLVSRALAGVGAAMYDPAARGYVVDATGASRQGEAFGLYGAAQFGGFLLGPVVGGVAAAATGDPTIVFSVAGFACLVAAALLAVRLPAGAPSVIPMTRDGRDDQPARAGDDVPDMSDDRPRRLLNRLLLAAVVLNAGSYFAGGSYEVIWSLYLTSLGAGLDLIGVTFAAFSIPVLVLSPVAGRLIDRRGGYGILVVGVATVALSGPLYPLVPEVWWVVVLSLVEGAAFAMVSPALFSLVARATPPGRSSTAQGIFGSAGTVGTITASLAAGAAAGIDLRLPFVVTGVAIGSCLLLGLALGGSQLPRTMRRRAPSGARTNPARLPEPAPGAARDG